MPDTRKGGHSSTPASNQRAFKPGAPRNELRRWLFATGNSIRGYQAVWQDEAAFRSELCVLVLLIAPAWWLAETWTGFILLLGIWVLVIAGELVNSAIEAAIDRIGPEIHPLSGKAKDAGSALILTLMSLAALVWLAVIADRFF